MTIELPIACSLDEQEAPARVAAWGELFNDSLIDRQATVDGVRLILSSSPETARRLDELVGLEAKCCAWMTFEVTEGDALSVDITAGDELGRRAVRDLFAEEVTGRQRFP